MYAHPSNRFGVDGVMAKSVLSLSASGRFRGSMTVNIKRLTETTDEFRALPFRYRRCYFADEKELSFFSTYSRFGCILECAWYEAQRSCQCVPWFLSHHFPHAAICHRLQNVCFKHVLLLRTRANRRANASTCVASCLPDCQAEKYQVKASSVGRALYADCSSFPRRGLPMPLACQHAVNQTSQVLVEGPRLFGDMSM